MRRLLAALLLAALAAPPAAARPARRPDAVSVPRPKGPEWFGVYLAGRKVGWMQSEVRRERRGGAAVLVARGEVRIRARLGEQEVERRQADEKVYEALPEGRLLSFRSERSGDGGSRTTEGTCTPQGCRVTLAAEGAAPEVRRIGPVGETAEQADAFRLAAASRGAVTGAQLDLEHLRVKRMRDVFQGRERRAGAGVEIAVSVVAESEATDRIPALYAVADDGRLVEMRQGQALVVRAEPEAVAKRLDRVDLFGLSRVALPGPLPRTVPGSVRFVLRGLPRALQQDGARQRWRPLPGGESELVVTARLPAARAGPGPAGAQDGLEPFLEATPAIDADDPGIRRLAAELTRGAAGPWEASRRLVRHVYQRLDKVFGQSRDRASEVLRAGKGDCTEHALLFLALARAAGIPARGVHGLVYARYQDGVPALYWHAWAEVYAGGEWIEVDPTFGQEVADPTHVALGRGSSSVADTQADAVAVLGALTVASAGPPGAP